MEAGIVRVRVCKDGTRIPYCVWRPGIGNPKRKLGFADAKDSAIAAMDRLGLYQHVLDRMDRKIRTGKGGYKPYGA